MSVLSREQFRQKLSKESDTGYIWALYRMAETISEQWVTDDIRSELRNRGYFQEDNYGQRD